MPWFALLLLKNISGAIMPSQKMPYKSSVPSFILLVLLVLVFLLCWAGVEAFAVDAAVAVDVAAMDEAD